MTTPDRSDDLLRLMLERRAGAPAPGWLLPGVAEAVRDTRQVRAGRAFPGLPGTRGFGRLGLVAAVALILLALAAGVLLAARLILPPPRPTLPAIVVAPSPRATLPPASAVPSEATEPTERPQPVPTPGAAALAPDTLAVVTPAGDDLRVRSKPGVGADSEKLSPLLQKGTRMLVVDGPVSADGYDWYEVQADNDLFGWVAAGKGSEAWISHAEPVCPDSLDESALWTVDPIDFLVCYGDSPVDVRVRMEVSGYEDECEPPPSPWCGGRPRWLFQARFFQFVDADGPKSAFLPVAHGAVVDRINGAPELAVLTLTVSMDAPQARGCRVVVRPGDDVISRDEAVTRCRLRFVVQDVASDPADDLLEAETLARVVAPSVPVYKEPGGARVEPDLVAGDEVLIVDAPELSGGDIWYPVLPSDRAGRSFGWVAYAGRDGAPTLDPMDLECPPIQDWHAVEALSPASRYVCFDAQEVIVDLLVVRREPRPSDGGACDTYRLTQPSPRPCVAEPPWLATSSGVTATDPLNPSGGVDVRFDPAQVEREWFPTTPTVLRITGSFANENYYACDVYKPGTHQSLLDFHEPETYCLEQFVVTSVGSVP